MNEQQLNKWKWVIAEIRILAKSQGFYGRLLESLEDLEEEQKIEFIKDLQKKDVRDTLDLVYYFEC